MFNAVRNMFESKNIGHNPICSECKSKGIKFPTPLLTFHLGDEFASSHHRLVFVGKTHRGEPGHSTHAGHMDARGTAKDLWFGKPDSEGKKQSWQFWRRTRDIAERVEGANAFNLIAITNLIKCSNSEGLDMTPPHMASSCITKLRLIWEELAILEARTVVFYTSNFYSNLLKTIPIAYENSILERSGFNNRVQCGKHSMIWWDRSCSTDWTDRMRILVTGHPQFKKKTDFVSFVSDWITES